MTQEERSLIKYRMERAYETLDEARILFKAGKFHAYVNRLYYACFYAVSALLRTKGFSTSKHSQLRSLMHREFVKNGVIPKELAKHFEVLFDNRLEGDYSDFIHFNAEDVAAWLKPTEDFITHIDRLIKTIK